MQEQNALIGVQMAAYFPDISLSAVLQWSGAGAFPFNVANEIWPLGGAATQFLFDGGLRGAQIDAARAVYWQSVATYRQTVLSAFQGVEDELAGRATQGGETPRRNPLETTWARRTMLSHA